MKKIKIKTVTEMLKEIGADESITELIYNNISLYNDLLADFQKGERHNAYLLYQLNNAIQKQIESVVKHNKKSVDKDEDKFNDFKNKFKKVETR